MKNLITLLALTLITLGSVQAQDIICKKSKGRWYPANDRAKQIAEMLNVKTCTGRRFNAVVKGLKASSNIPLSKRKLSVDDIIMKMSK
jgi:hypothetical protein